MAKQKTETLFEESSQGAVSAITAVVFVLSMVFMLGGFLLLSYSFQSGLEGAHIYLFGGGLAATVLGFMIPFTVLPSTGK